ncbi:MAG: aldehyde dehydrogenase family protein [Micropruina sp.]|uniref:aldehyde dehydrogenase family protein n=1 Tax=Micropruina sp. TaxID=2737536 RepID=UPI0039E4E7B8
MAIADEIEARGRPRSPKSARQETGLPAARLEGERARTTFAASALRLSHSARATFSTGVSMRALPDRKPLPRPEIRLMQRPVGPVGGVRRLEFPARLLGGGRRYRLGAGRRLPGGGQGPSGPSRHGRGGRGGDPRGARPPAALPEGVFSLIHGGRAREIGAALVTHPLIRAVGFTGSLGRRAARSSTSAARRPEPIPFFGELGSVNPVFVLPAALAARGPRLIAEDWAGVADPRAPASSAPDPGIVVLAEGRGGEAFIDARPAALEQRARRRRC